MLSENRRFLIDDSFCAEIISSGMKITLTLNIQSAPGKLNGKNYKLILNGNEMR